HDARRKIGIITSADIAARAMTSSRDGACRVSATREASHITVAGYLFARDFPEIVRELRGPASIGLHRSGLIAHSEERRDEEALPLRSSLGQVAVHRSARDLTKSRATQDHLHASSEQKRQPTAEACLERSREDRRPTTLGQRPKT